MKSIIVAYDRTRGIGADNDLLWQRDLPADLHRFRDLTMGHPIIMGRKTFDSIGRALPGRQNIVVSHSMQPTEGIFVVGSLDEAYAIADGEPFVIGGGQMYAESIDSVDRIFATEVDAEFATANVFFPFIDPSVWTETERMHHDADDKNKYGYDFVTYVRR